jgi:hypothetical protein
MFFLVTGASGAGKSTVRRLIEQDFGDALVSTEIATLGVTPQWDLAWRHKQVERLVGLALEAQRVGKPFLLCGDPVPMGEVYAAPSADRLDGIAVCLLDVSEQAQRERLVARGDDPALLPNHVAFAEWMREHAADPTHRPDVIMDEGWEEMCWDRWVGRPEARDSWRAHVIDTSSRRPTEVARLVAAWIRDSLNRADTHLSKHGT